MTNGWIDIKNTDMMLIMGGNPAENHPCGFKWAIEAKRQRNAKMIVVDPRFTRTAAVADLFLQIRAGADIAFLGGLIRYAIENGRIARDYLLHYTNAAFLIQEGFKLPEDGLFSGFDAATARLRPLHLELRGAQARRGWPTIFRSSTRARVFQLLKQQYSRYTPEMVERITGIPKDQFLKAADLFTSIRKDGDMKKAATIIYAVGWTHHSFGTQIIRAAAILQLLHGQRGTRRRRRQRSARPLQHSGRHRHGRHLRPSPRLSQNARAHRRRFQDLHRPHHSQSRQARPVGIVELLVNTPKFAVSLLKALYGDAAHKGERLGLPLSAEARSQVLLDRNLGRHVPRHVKGMFAFGMNGVAIGPNSQKNIDALKKADWLVVCEIYPDETSEFWKSPGISTDDMKKIHTTVYRLPGAGFAEKDGTFVNSARWLQWKGAALPPPGLAKLDQEILARIFLKRARTLRRKKAASSPTPSCTPPGTTPIRTILRSPKSPAKSTAARSPMSPTPSSIRPSRPASSCPASAGCATTVPPPAATGSIAARGPKRAP